MILFEAVGLFMARKQAEGLRPSSLANLRATFNHLLTALGEQFEMAQFDAVAEDTFRVFLSCLQPRKGNAISRYTVRRHVRNVQMLLAFHGRRSATDPYQCESVRVRKSKGVIWSRDELRQLRQHAADGKLTCIKHWQSVERSVFFCSLFDFALLTGMRIGEILAARYDWIHGDFLHLPDDVCKTGVGRAVYLSPSVLASLEGLKLFGPTIDFDASLLFPWPFKQHHLYTCVKKWCREAGFPENRCTGMHAFRRCHATLLAGISPDAAKWSCGHSDSQITWEHYVDRNAIKSSLDQLGCEVDSMKGGAA